MVRSLATGPLGTDEILAAQRALDLARRNRDAAVSAVLRKARQDYEDARRERDQAIVQAMKARALPRARIAEIMGLSVSRIKQLPAELHEADERPGNDGTAGN